MRVVSPCAFATVLLAAFGSAGCVENESSLFISGVMALSAPECTASADPGATMLAGGTLDVGLRDRYTAALLVGNQLVQRGSSDQIRTETARISLKGAEVRVNSSAGEPLDEYTVDGTGFVDPSSGTTPGYGVFFAMLVQPNTAGIDSMGAGDSMSIVTNVKVFGRTLGGKEIESNELSFPIQVCSGCLVTFPPEATATATPGGSCIGNADDVEEVPCYLGQDMLVDCRLCTGSAACSVGG